MAGQVEFQDFSFTVKAELNDATIGWAQETGNEIAAQAQRNCKMEDDEGKQLKGSYKCQAGNTDGEFQVGSPLESAYWEEWGTGEYAAHGDGRKGWWIYCPDQESMGGGATYYDEMEAMMMAAYIQQVYKKRAYVTNGRKPNYTLEHAFDAVKKPAMAQLERILKEKMGT
jgi:hypothetical protein